MRIFCGAIGVSLFMSGAVLADTNSDCAHDANCHACQSRRSALIQDTRGSNAVAYFNAIHQCLCGARFRLSPRPSQISVKRSR